MKYSDLVKFEPIESVIQLEQANSVDAVRQLVQTFVISKGMADQLCDIVIPNLQFETPADNKGVLIVGNYGTGKSHLLSLISGLAEQPDMAKFVRNKDVAKAAKAISGKFKVVRLEIPATKKSLRNIICGRLEDFLSDEELSFSFPADDQVDSNKDDLTNMMAQFNEKYPNHGLLLVVDELLDYLRSRNGQEVILDLGFLREMGEVSKQIRFRLIAGLQESLFDNPKFQFIAESLRRVKDRFEQLRIVRQDVAYVVSERLLTKNDEQKAKIREHLQKFTPLYGGMAERLEEFVRLFPVHPTYLEVFEAISIAEKREVLKTLSAEIKRCFNNNVPQDQPGLISYDSYWEFLQGKRRPAFRPGNPRSDRREQGRGGPDSERLHTPRRSSRWRCGSFTACRSTASPRTTSGPRSARPPRNFRTASACSPRSRRRPATSCEPQWKPASRKSCGR